MTTQKTQIALPALLVLSLGLMPNRLAAQEKVSPVEVRELQKERLAVLRQLKNLTEEWYGIGKTTINAVQQVRLQLQEAQLEMATEPEAQKKLREEYAKEAEMWEKKVAKSVNDGHKPGIDAMYAKVFRLDAQIALEKARTRLGGSKDRK